MSKFSDILSEVRSQKSLTLQEMADILSVSNGYISRLESGATPSYEFVQNFCTKFNIKLSFVTHNDLSWIPTVNYINKCYEERLGELNDNTPLKLIKTLYYVILAGFAEYNKNIFPDLKNFAMPLGPVAGEVLNHLKEQSIKKQVLEYNTNIEDPHEEIKILVDKIFETKIPYKSAIQLVEQTHQDEGVDGNPWIDNYRLATSTLIPDASMQKHAKKIIEQYMSMTG